MKQKSLPGFTDLNTPQKVIDFTRYDLPAHDPPDTTPQHPVKDWNLINRINQKGLRPQDKPVSLQELQDNEKDLIFGFYADLNKF